MTDIFAQVMLSALIPALLVYACFSDLFTMTISNRLCLAVAAAFPLFAIVVGLPAEMVMWHMLAGACVLVVAFVLFAFGWIGGGDAKFFAAATIWLGFGQMWEYIALSSILGGALTMALLAARRHPLPSALVRLPWVNKLHDVQTGVPYGIALGVAAVMLLPHGAVWRAAL